MCKLLIGAMTSVVYQIISSKKLSDYFTCNMYLHIYLTLVCTYIVCKLGTGVSAFVDIVVRALLLLMSL